MYFWTNTHLPFTFLHLIFLTNKQNKQSRDASDFILSDSRLRCCLSQRLRHLVRILGNHLLLRLVVSVRLVHVRVRVHEALRDDDRHRGGLHVHVWVCETLSWLLEATKPIQFINLSLKRKQELFRATSLYKHYTIWNTDVTPYSSMKMFLNMQS